MVNGNGPMIGYVLANFPCYSEAFILDELLEFKRRGYRLRLFVLRKPDEPVVQKGSDMFQEDLVYAPPPADPRLWLAQIPALFMHPCAYFSELSRILFRCCMRPRILLKHLFAFCAAAFFVREVQTAKPLHIHAHFADHPATCVHALWGFTKVPFSVTAHAHDLFADHSLIAGTAADSVALVTISMYNFNYLVQECGVPSSKVKVIRCGIDPDRFRPHESKRGQVLKISSLGRLVETKGFDDLIEACRILKGNGRSVRCEIGGDGPDRGLLEKRVRDAGLGFEVHFLGALSHEAVEELMARSDLFVLAAKRAATPDVQDGIPVALMEALAMELPVVTTAISGIPELVIDGQTGTVCASGDPVDLARAVGRVADSFERARSMARNGRELILKEYSLRVRVDSLENVFMQPANISA